MSFLSIGICVMSVERYWFSLFLLFSFPLLQPDMLNLPPWILPAQVLPLWFAQLTFYRFCFFSLLSIFVSDQCMMFSLYWKSSATKDPFCLSVSVCLSRNTSALLCLSFHVCDSVQPAPANNCDRNYNSLASGRWPHDLEIRNSWHTYQIFTMFSQWTHHFPVLTRSVWSQTNCALALDLNTTTQNMCNFFETITTTLFPPSNGLTGKRW